MKQKTIILAVMAMLVTASAMAQVGFVGNNKRVFDEIPPTNTGLNHIYVLYNSEGVSMTYTASTDRTVTWMGYGEQGGGAAEEITNVTHAGRVTTLQQVIPDHGYIIYEGTDPTYVWVTDYSKGYLQLNGLSAQNEDGDCGTVTLSVDGSGNDLVYYTILGVRRELNRQMVLEYKTLEWSDEDQEWQEVTEEEVQETFKSTIAVPAPYHDTTFTLRGDRFLDFWGESISKTSDTYYTKAVDVRAVVVQEERDHQNEKKSEGGNTLGGSAPVHIVFTGKPTDAVVHKEWQMSRDSEFSDIELRLNQDEVDEVFEESGLTYWRFVGSNDDGTCEAYSDVYTVNVGVSELYCPNVFSPGSTKDTNDVWMVSYKSIVDFECWIFNRWGQQVAHLTHPSQGWDGRYKGKLVSAGVYYYVIKARGSDGKPYNLSGDINIIRYKSNPHTSGFDGGGNDGGNEDGGENKGEIDD